MQYGSQHGRNIVATWSQHDGRKERLLMLDVASNRVRNIFITHSQHARNIYLVVFRSNGWQLRILRSTGHGPVRRWRPDVTIEDPKIYRPWTRPTLAPGSDVRALAVP
jgi:hypothetical protein